MYSRSGNLRTATIENGIRFGKRTFSGPRLDGSRVFKRLIRVYSHFKVLGVRPLPLADVLCPHLRITNRHAVAAFITFIIFKTLIQ